MLAFERREAITKKIERDKKVLVSDLSNQFGVSEETIRRDLEKLEKEGIVNRTHGGATINKKNSPEIPYITRDSLNKDLKDKIAKKVSDIIPDNATLMVDASSTVFEALNTLKGLKKNLSVITNSIDILSSFLNSDLQLVATGGTMRKNSQSMVGPTTEMTLKRYNVDFGIFSCRGLSLDNGVMDSNEPESQVKKAMSERSTKIIMLVDSTKFDTESFINVFSLDEIDYLVTDKKPPQAWIDICKEKYIHLIY